MSEHFITKTNMSSGQAPNSIRITTQKLLSRPKYQIEKQFTPQLAKTPDVPWLTYWYRTRAKSTKFDSKSRPMPGGKSRNCCQNRQVANKIEAIMEIGRKILRFFAAASLDNSTCAPMASRTIRTTRTIPCVGFSSALDFVR